MAFTDPEDGILVHTPDGEWLVGSSMPVYHHHKVLCWTTLVKYSSPVMGNLSLKNKNTNTVGLLNMLKYLKRPSDFRNSVKLCQQTSCLSIHKSITEF